MGLFNNFPYLDLSNLNLDFVLKKLKDLTTYSQAAEDAATRAEAAAGSVHDDAEAAERSAQLAADSAELASASEQSAKYYADHIADPVNGIVTQWLDDHPEATTTVQDGSISTAKLANAAVTQEKLDPNVTINVADNAVTTDKIADHNVTFEKTDFYYNRSVLYEFPAWLTQPQAKQLHVASGDLEAAMAGFPDVLTFIGRHTSQYNVTYGAAFTARDSSWNNKNSDIVKTTRRLLYNGFYYFCLTVTKQDVLTAYAAYLEDLNNGYLPRPDSSGGMNLTLNRTSGSWDATYVIDSEPTQELIESGFMETYISEDFATAVVRVLESDEGVSTDEEEARNALNGKVMICLGDSYMVGMGGQLATLAAKYNMKIDNRGVVSSSICGDLNGNKGFSPMWNRADTIVSNYTSGYVIDGNTYHASDVGIVAFMGGANDGFGISTWIGSGINETDKEKIYGACNHIFDVLAGAFTGAKLICITQPSNYSRVTSSVTDNATAQTLGFDSLAQLQAMNDTQFSNYAMAVKERAVKDTAWTYGWHVIDMFTDFPTIFNPANKSAYWQNDKLHLNTSGYKLICDELDKAIVKLVVHGIA